MEQEVKQENQQLEVRKKRKRTYGKFTPAAIEEIKEKTREYVRIWRVKNDMIKPIIPSIADLALKLKIDRKSVYNLMEKDEEFRQLVEEIETIQEKILIVLGLTRRASDRIISMLLARHGYYTEKVQSDVDVNKQYLIELSIPQKNEKRELRIRNIDLKLPNGEKED